MNTAVWIQASRPRTLITSASPIFIGSVMAYTAGALRFSVFFFTLVTALAIQIGTNLANDYFDFLKGADTTARKGPVRVTQAGLAAPNQVKRAFILVFLLAALLGLFLIWEGGLLFAMLLAISIALGVLYTAGPYSLAYLGLGDFFVLLFFGPIATCATYWLQTHAFSFETFLAGIAPGSLAWAILIANNLRDIDEDRAAGKKTLCVRGGKNLGQWLYLSALALALSTPFIWVKSHPFALLAMLTAIPATSAILKLYKNEEVELFKATAKLPLIYTLFFAIGWMI